MSSCRLKIKFSFGMAFVVLLYALATPLVARADAYHPSVMVGMQVNPKNPFQLNFIFDRGQELLSDFSKKREYQKIIEYFLASLTIPNHEMWVNLSPYEKNRIIPDNLGQTAMGRDLLAQDYLLKEITSSLIDPHTITGKRFWQEVYRKARQQFGTTNIPVNTFNKVWIVPDKADVYEKNGTVMIIKSHLKVMLEEDYLAVNRHSEGERSTIEESKGVLRSFVLKSVPQEDKCINALGSRIVREIVIPELTQEVNEGKDFAKLRQIYSGMLMATWFKKTLRQSVLGQAYADRSKIQGMDLQGTQDKEKIYQEYVKVFKKGAFNFIKEDVDPLTGQSIPRKYFSGGMRGFDEAMIHDADAQEITDSAKIPLEHRWDTAEVILQQFLRAEVFPDEADRKHLAGKGKVYGADEGGNAQDPELGWIPLTDHVVVRWFKRNPHKKFILKRREIRMPNNFPFYLYRLPRDITLEETLELIDDMQKLPLANREKLILPHTALKFAQMANFLNKLSDADSNPEARQELIKALEQIAGKLGAWGDVATDENIEAGLKEWFGSHHFEGDLNIPQMISRMIQLGIQSVQIELEELTFWRGENLFKHGLETSEVKKHWLFNQIDLDALKARLNLYPAGSFQADEEKIKVIQEILAKVRALPGVQTTSALEVIYQEAPSIELMTNRINCVGKSALTALYLNALGIKVWAVDVHALQQKQGSAEHVLLLAYLSGHKFYIVEPSDSPEKSHEIYLSISDQQIPVQGMPMEFSEMQDPDLKRAFVGPWAQMITAMFYGSLAVVLGNNDLKGAVTANRKAIMLYPNYASAHANLGVTLLNQGNIDQALEMEKRAAQLNPLNPKNWDNWGSILYRKGDIKGAIEKHRKAIELSPLDPVIRNNLAVALYKDKDIEGAIAEYEKAIEIDPRQVIANNNLQIIFNETKAYQRAIQYFRQQVRLNPDNSLAHNNLGFFLGKIGQIDEEIIEYKEAVRLDPQNSIAWSNLGVVLWGVGQQKDSVDAHWQAFRLNSSNETVMGNLENALSAVGDHHQLVEFYHKKTKLRPYDSIAWNNLGYALYKTNNVPAAIHAYKQSLIADPHNETAKANLKELEQDQAMSAPGGIDLNEDLLDMRIYRDSEESPLMMRLDEPLTGDIKGLIPVILRIVPTHDGIH